MIVAIDTETGGLDPAAHPLLSISMVELDADLMPHRAIDVFVLPQDDQPISPEAQRVNGYTPKAWADRGAVPLRDAMLRIARWLPRDASPLAHNAGFDRGFVDAAGARSGVRIGLGYRWRCSMVAMMAADDALGLGFPNAKLETLARACGHWAPDYQRGDHQAKDDTLACAAGYRWLMGRMRAGLPAKKEAKA